jgi:hypothetical protein
MEWWNDAILGFFRTSLKNITIHEMNQSGETVRIDPQNLDPNTEVMRF